MVLSTQTMKLGHNSNLAHSLLFATFSLVHSKVVCPRSGQESQRAPLAYRNATERFKLHDDRKHHWNDSIVAGRLRGALSFAPSKQLRSSLAEYHQWTWPLTCWCRW